MIGYIKENFTFIYITLCLLLSTASGLYNYKYSDVYIQDMRNIVNLIMQDVDEEGEYSSTFRYVSFPYYNMSYEYYAPYDNHKTTILNNINSNENFVSTEENVYPDSTSIKYCHGIYEITFAEMLDGSRMGFSVNYSMQSDCYKNNS